MVSKTAARRHAPRHAETTKKSSLHRSHENNEQSPLQTKHHLRPGPTSERPPSSYGVKILQVSIHGIIISLRA